MTATGGGDTAHVPRMGDIVDAAQRAAGIVAARHRRDPDGVRGLLQSFPDDATLAGGCLLLADLVLRMYSANTGQNIDACVQQLTLDLDRIRETDPQATERG